MTYDPLSADKWVFIWGNSSYKSSKLYKLAFRHIHVPPTFKWIWKSKCIPRPRFFSLLLLVDRLHTKTMLTRKNYTLDSNDYFVLCNSQIHEDVQYLFFRCPFALSCWQKIWVTWISSSDIDSAWFLKKKTSKMHWHKRDNLFIILFCRDFHHSCLGDLEFV